MNRPRFVEPACLACSLLEQCGSCARQSVETNPSSDAKQVRRIRFVAADKRRSDTNMHFAPKNKISMEPVINESACNSDGTVAFNGSTIDASKSIAQLSALGFTNEELVATTSTSVIFRASMSSFQGSLAIKILKPELLKSRFAKKIFSQEASMVMELTHPNIAALYDFGVAADGAPYLVSQYVPGISLQQLIKQSLTVDPIILFSQICEALAHAHQLKVVHGRLSTTKIITSPISPNIFLAKIIDFSVVSSLLWQLPFTIGTLRPSASPEERAGNDPDFRSDIYSLGCLMYETITGAEPTFFNRSKRPIPFPRLRGAAALLEPLVERCLAYDPADRYQSVADLLKDLRDVEARLG